jgi:hypothetical protein
MRFRPNSARTQKQQHHRSRSRTQRINFYIESLHRLNDGTERNLNPDRLIHLAMKGLRNNLLPTIQAQEP